MKEEKLQREGKSRPRGKMLRINRGQREAVKGKIFNRAKVQVDGPKVLYFILVFQKVMRKILRRLSKIQVFQYGMVIKIPSVMVQPSTTL